MAILGRKAMLIIKPASWIIMLTMNEFGYPIAFKVAYSGQCSLTSEYNIWYRIIALTANPTIFLLCVGFFKNGELFGTGTDKCGLTQIESIKGETVNLKNYEDLKFPIGLYSASG